MLADKFERDILAAVLRHVADDARKAAEQLLHRNHANLEDGFVKLVEHARLKRESVRHFCANWIACMTLIEFRESAMQHGLADNQFPDEVHYGVNTRCVHAQ